MRVLHVIPSVSLVHGGPSHAIRSMEESLLRLGVEVATATTDDDGRGARLPCSLGQQAWEGHSARWYFRKNTEFYKVSWSFLGWVRREVHSFDVVHIHALFSFTSIAAAWAARRAGIPYVVRPLGVLARYGVTQRRPWLKRLSLRFVEGPLLRDAAAVHFTSDAERDEAMALRIPMRPAIIPLGLTKASSTTLGAPEVAKGGAGSRILYLSRLDPKKNVEGLLGALAILRSEGLVPSLTVAGSGQASYVGELRGMAHALGLGEQVTWTGHLSGESKAAALARADLFVLPSHSENFGIAAAEALAAGLPCILGRGVAISRSVEDAGAGVAVDPEPESIAAGLRRFLIDAGLQENARGAAVRLAHQEYSQERMGERLLALYEAVVAPPAASDGKVAA